jgi:hypothetical protein
MFRFGATSPLGWHDATHAAIAPSGPSAQWRLAITARRGGSLVFRRTARLPGSTRGSKPIDCRRRAITVEVTQDPVVGDRREPELILEPRSRRLALLGSRSTARMRALVLWLESPHGGARYAPAGRSGPAPGFVALPCRHEPVASSLRFSRLPETAMARAQVTFLGSSLQRRNRRASLLRARDPDDSARNQRRRAAPRGRQHFSDCLAAQPPGFPDVAFDGFVVMAVHFASPARILRQPRVRGYTEQYSASIAMQQQTNPQAMQEKNSRTWLTACRP